MMWQEWHDQTSISGKSIHSVFGIHISQVINVGTPCQGKDIHQLADEARVCNTTHTSTMIPSARIVRQYNIDVLLCTIKILEEQIMAVLIQSSFASCTFAG